MRRPPFLQSSINSALVYSLYATLNFSTVFQNYVVAAFGLLFNPH